MTTHDRTAAPTGALARRETCPAEDTGSTQPQREFDAVVAAELYEAQQILTYAAFRIPTGTYTGEQWRGLADTLDDLAALAPHVRRRCAAVIRSD